MPTVQSPRSATRKPRPPHVRSGLHINESCYASLRIPRDVKERAAKLAADEGTSFSGLVQFLLEKKLSAA